MFLVLLVGRVLACFWAGCVCAGLRLSEARATHQHFGAHFLLQKIWEAVQYNDTIEASERVAWELAEGPAPGLALFLVCQQALGASFVWDVEWMETI
jgi:hypothetical protein